MNIALVPVVNKENHDKFGVLFTGQSEVLPGVAGTSGALKPGVSIDLIAISQNKVAVELGLMSTDDKVVPETLYVKRLHFKIEGVKRPITVDLGPESNFHFRQEEEVGRQHLYHFYSDVRDLLAYLPQTVNRKFAGDVAMPMSGHFDTRDNEVEINFDDHPEVQFLGYELHAERTLDKSVDVRPAMKTDTYVQLYDIPMLPQITLKRLVPILTPQNASQFLIISDKQENPDRPTAPLRFGKNLELMRLSETPELLAGGEVNSTDYLHKVVILHKVVTVHDNQYTFHDVFGLNGSNFVQGQDNANRRAFLEFFVPGADIGSEEDFVYFTGSVDYVSGMLTMSKPRCKDVDVVGFVLFGHRANNNRIPKETTDDASTTSNTG